MADRYVTMSAYGFTSFNLLAPAYMAVSVPPTNQELEGAVTIIFRSTTLSLTINFGRIDNSMHT
jgi:hypothetical protein